MSSCAPAARGLRRPSLDGRSWNSLVALLTVRMPGQEVLGWTRAAESDSTLQRKGREDKRRNGY